jgi:hypothetical protein
LGDLRLLACLLWLLGLLLLRLLLLLLRLLLHTRRLPLRASGGVPRIERKAQQ